MSRGIVHLYVLIYWQRDDILWIHSLFCEDDTRIGIHENRQKRMFVRFRLMLLKTVVIL